MAIFRDNNTMHALELSILLQFDVLFLWEDIYTFFELENYTSSHIELVR